MRIGNMDGIFVAYHNTARVFGFQYIPREELDYRIYGNSQTGDAAFNLLLQIYERILEAIVPLYPKDHVLRITFAAERTGSKLLVFAEDLGDGKGLPSVTATVPGKDLRHFVVTMASSVNGFRTENVLITDSQADKWEVDLVIQQKKALQSEYDVSRKRFVVERGQEDDSPQDMAFVENIRRSTAHSIALEPSNPVIIPPWARA